LIFENCIFLDISTGDRERTLFWFILKMKFKKKKFIRIIETDESIFLREF